MPGAVELAALAAAAAVPADTLEIAGAPQSFAPASSPYSEVRLTFSPDGRTALWFSRDRPGGAGGYDIWMSRRRGARWSDPEPVSFNSAGRDFDPAFSADGRFVYFCSDRPGTLGGDDLYAVPVAASGFGTPVHLGGAVNSVGSEWGPMTSPNGSRLIFSSDRAGGRGGHDLFEARGRGIRFAGARALAGAVNSEANEIDPSFLSDGSTIVFSRAMDLRRDRLDLVHAGEVDGRYDAGSLLPATVNNGRDVYGAMLDWSGPGRLTFSRDRGAAGGMDAFIVRYRLRPRARRAR